ncbi:MAG: hypothetical protein K2M54_01495 [Muribaculaceae bacterium]|nr:hypothetical protein [Muribaculaceae bacterium]
MDKHKAYREKDLLHIITKTGERTTIPFPGYNQINEAENDEYNVDIDWYLSNGYTKLEDAIKEIEKIWKKDGM